MLEDQVANLLQRYLGNYVRGLNKEALKISVWRGDVELTNMQLKPEALNALKLPVKVKAGFLGSVKLKVPWSRLGQEPVLVYLDRIFLLAEPATHVESCSEDAVQEAKKSKVREMEMKLLERAQQLKSEMNKSWLGSLIDTIVGNLKLSISNIHIRYEDLESNPDHPFAMGLTLEKLIAVTIDDNGKETFVTGGALDRIQKSVELEQIALYLDSGISPWHLDEPWEDLLPAEWAQVFRFGTDGGKPANRLAEKHTYILQPVTGNAKYVKLRPNEYANDHQPRQRAAVNLDDVTLCLSKNGYRDVLKLADNFASFSQRLKYAHFRPPVAVKASPSLWWKYAYRAISDQMKKSSGKLSWDQVLKYARLRKRYISLYAQLLKSDPSRVIIDDSKDIEELDRELDIELILQWRMLAHKFVDQSAEADAFSKKQRGKKSWWSFGRSRPSIRDESETFHFSEEDWEQLNRMIGYKEEDGGQTMIIDERKDALHTLVEIQMKHNASKLIDESRECLAALSCESLGCSVKLYPETKVFDLKLGSYQLSSPNGLLAESATPRDSLVGVFCYKPFDAKVDWSLVAKASPCYVTYLKDSIDQVVKFFESDSGLSPQIALETAAALQMTIDEVKRTAQQQMNRALRDQSRFSLDLDIAAPKITIPTDFKPDDVHSTKLLLDLGNLMIRAQDDQAEQSTEEMDTFLRFNLVLSDVSAFLVDGDYFWHQTTSRSSKHTGSDGCTFFPVIDRCGIMLSLEQNRLENPSYPSTRIAMRLPSLGFHFSPARYHRLMRVFKIFQNEDGDSSYSLRPWSQADLEGWLFLLVWKGMANREAVWQRRYLCLVGPFLYVLDRPSSRSYKQCISLRGKQVCHVPAELVGNADNVLAICEAARSNSKVVEDVNALIVRCDNIESRKLWQTRIQGAIYHASGSAAIANLSESSSDLDDSVKGDNENQDTSLEKVFVTGLLDELKICFYCNLQHGQSFMRVLMAEENRLFEFRAIGGQVELLVRENEMLVGTLLRSLEIEDLLLNDSISRRQYLVRSFIGSVDTCSCPDDIQSRGLNGDERTGSEGDEKFYEAPESLADSVDSPMQSSLSFSENQGSEFSSKSQNLSLEPPGFDRVPGLLPYYTLETTGRDSELIDTLNSFVKAQIIVHDQSSPLYNNIDKQVTVTLATVSFYCRRPTILAIMEFVSAINTEEEHCESFSGNPSMAIASHDNHRDGIGDDQRTEAVAEEPVVKGLLGKGKSRIVFNLMLNMARAQILLMNEREAKVATLLQDNLVTDIKVFPSSFLIKAALGNLRISDDSLPSNHMYFWICDMRNPGGSSFVELLFSSFNVDDEDYEGYDYALSGELSEVRIVYLNRFVEEVVSYFMGLVPSSSKSVVKIKDQVTDSEKWFSTSEIEGSPAVKLDLSLRKPIILMPRRTDSIDYLKLDIVHITVQNNFQWLFGSRKEINAVHVDILTILVKDINLNVGIGAELGESIIQDVKGVSVVIRRSLRDILHQVPSSEISIKIGEIKAALSSREYQIITECAKDNFSETPNLAPTLNDSVVSSAEVDASLPQVSEVESASTSEESWTTTKVSVVINLVVLCLHTGVGGDTSLATVQVSGVWVLYKSNKLGDGFLSASLDGFTVIDDREGTEEGLRLAVGKSEDVSSSSLRSAINNKNGSIDHAEKLKDDIKLVPTMLILDAKFSQSSTVMSLCVQRPQLLVALDFLLAVVEFFVPSAGDLLSHEDGERSMPFNVIEAITLDQSVYRQPSAEITLSPQRPLIVDDERYNHFIYDGQGGTLYLKDGQGLFLSAPSKEIIIYVGNGKKLQLKNVIIKDGRYLDSCIFLGANSSYTASKDDHVYLEELDQTSCTPLLKEGVNRVLSQHSAVARATGLIIELQAIGPELTFYSTSKDVGQSQSLILSNKLLHAQLDAFCRLVLKNDTIEMSANALGLTMESNGIRILEPFDTTVNYSNVSGKTNINICFSDIFMNLSFSILRLFLAVEEDVLTFLRRSSKKMTVVCTQFDEVGTIRDPQNDQVYVFWRPRAPPGFAVLGDYLTPTEKPPTKGVTAINTNFLRVKKPVSFRLVWSTLDAGVGSEQCKNNNGSSPSGILNEDGGGCSVWFPEAPKGYVALGCVVSQGRKQPQLSSVSCILTSLVTPCSLRDCITIRPGNQFSSTVAFWRVGNSAGTFLPADGSTSFLNVAYELRHIMLPFLDSSKASESASIQASSSYINAPEGPQPERSVVASSGRRFEAVANFQLVWWNQGSNSRRRLSIWRPVVPQGTVYFGDIAVQGYEPPSTCIVLHDTGGEEHFKAPSDFQLVGQIKKQKGMESISFWMPQAPPGFVSLGSVACKNVPKQNEFSALRCIRSDMVCGDQFLEESLWDTSDTKIKGDAFSIWTVGNDLGTFIVRSGFKKPSRRFALKLADPGSPSGADDTVIDVEVKTFSAALFDDYGGLMVPLCNVSLSGLGFSLHGRQDRINSTASFSLDVRSYNDKYDAWEPLVEPVDGFLRYQYDLNAPGAASQLRFISRRALNLNVSVSNANMIVQAYASWSSLSHVHESNKQHYEKTVSSTCGGGSVIGVHHKRDYYIIPRNKLGQDIFIRATEIRGLSNIIRMPSGDMKPLRVPVMKNMLDSHMKGKLFGKVRAMVTVLVADAEITRVEGSTSGQYAGVVRLVKEESVSSESMLNQLSARTRGLGLDHSSSSEHGMVNWSEMFFFKVDDPGRYVLELIVIDMGKGDSVGFFSAPLEQVAEKNVDFLSPSSYLDKLSWMDLSCALPKNSAEGENAQKCGRIRGAIFVAPRYELQNGELLSVAGKRPGFVQISPSREGPWTTVRLNYAAPAACWRLDNDVVASEVIVKDGDRYVDIRSLVTVKNNTDTTLDLCLKSRRSDDEMASEGGRIEVEHDKTEVDEFFETEEYSPINGWTSSSYQDNSVSGLPSGWEWIDNWQLDKTSVNTGDGWVYAPDIESLKWPESYDSLKSVNYARRRRWIRSRRPIPSYLKREISLGQLSPGDTVPLPLSSLIESEHFVLHLRPFSSQGSDEYSWSSVVDKLEDSGKQKGNSKICVSALAESDELLYCTQLNGTSLSGSQKLWFCVSIQATELAKDVRSDPIQDWSIVIKSPMSLSNFLPLAAEFTVLELRADGHSTVCARGILCPGMPVNVYSADIRNPLYFSLLPQKGWSPVHETVILSHPRGVPSKTMSLRSAFTGRIVQIIIEQNYDREQPMLAKAIRIYAPYWVAVARCPPLKLRFIDRGGEKFTRKIALPFHFKKSDELIFEEIAEEEIYDGYTIASALNSNLLGLSASLSGEERFGTVKDLSLLGDMDGSLDIDAYDADGKCVKLFISTKPCPYQSIPTKVICIRPFLTFTNRLGQDILLKLSSEDDAKVLRACDYRVSFSYQEDNRPYNLQVRLDDTEWSYPIHITKEDTISLVLRTQNGSRKFVRTEIRGYEEGSRFIVVFRLGSASGPIRMENRITGKRICIRQTGFNDKYWINLEPFSTTNFSWEDPYGQKFIEAKIDDGNISEIWKFDLEETGFQSVEQGELKIKFYAFEIGDIKVARFTNGTSSDLHVETRLLTSMGTQQSNHLQTNAQSGMGPLELVVELGVVGVSLVDHKPKELSYLYFERVFMSYSTGYDGGTTTRFKLILGYLQLDNQLPLTLMPVLLAPEQATDIHHPVFKMTIAVCNENPDGVLVYPYVYIRVTDKVWRLNIHEPIIWALVDLYSNIQLDRLPQTSSVTQVDPEIRVNLVDISEVRLKVSLETAPAQRPRGVLGVWSPILSAVGKAFKIQIHLRRVMRKDRFMRKSSILPAVGNRIMRDLIHNPLHLLFSVDVLGMASSTLASLSRGFAELSTDGQFLQLRSKQVRSRRITGVGDGILQGTGALAQGVAFGVSGVVKKPVESAKQSGILGLAHGVGRAFVGFVVQPVSGALDFFSMTVDGIGASCSKFLEVLNKSSLERIRNPRAIHADGILRDYCEREALGQMILYLAEASRHFGCTEIFKEPSKFAWSDYYEEHFFVPYQRILLVTNKRVMLLQCLDLDNLDKRPCKIMWDVPWQELMALELAKAGSSQPSHLILHLKKFRRSENFVRVIKCVTEEESGRVPQAVTICSVVRKMWKAYQSDTKSLVLKVPSSQRHVYFAWSEADGRGTRNLKKAIVRSRDFSSSSSASEERRFVKHTISFRKIWSSERETKGHCTLCQKKISDTAGLCSIWRPTCPDGYVSVGDIARVGNHPPNCAAVYQNIEQHFALPIGYDLVWRNCLDDYTAPVSIWQPRAPEGFVSLGCVAVSSFTEPEPDLVYCVAESLAEQTEFEEQKIWSDPDSYPWACHIYQIQSDALHFVALRQTKGESDWKPMRVRDEPLSTSNSLKTH